MLEQAVHCCGTWLLLDALMACSTDTRPLTLATFRHACCGVRGIGMSGFARCYEWWWPCETPSGTCATVIQSQVPGLRTVLKVEQPAGDFPDLHVPLHHLHAAVGCGS